eukprot:CAMPEP_0119376114 /NCGR_PEP_ID=MMETSP1334-20130426/38944_1 /TAXON_ID=127549 /ORGANISM="Calcidiscus leptoporus, Strain RCC1130" /LENGTH=42 /DNA_ID= /DNA_START= /DNA_END= /DNA_ORIENTATION=
MRWQECMRRGQDRRARARATGKGKSDGQGSETASLRRSHPPA